MTGALTGCADRTRPRIPADQSPSTVRGARPCTEFRILGRLEAVRDGTVLDLGPTKQRALLALLLCRANTVVSRAKLTRALWPDAQPRSAGKNLQTYVSGLRRAVLGSDPDCDIAHQPPGYQVTVAGDALDAVRFKTLLRSGRSMLHSGDLAGAVDALRGAVDLWRGPALAEFGAFPALHDEAERLESLRLGCYEDLIEAHLGRGDAIDLLDEIEDLCRAHPLRERLRSLQMDVLHRSCRQAAALAVFDEVRQGLARELGLSPSPALQRKYQTILRYEADGNTNGADRVVHPR